MKRFWKVISIFGTLGGGLAFMAAGFAADLQLGLRIALDLVVITTLANTYKYFFFKPRPDNPEGIRPEKPFEPYEIWNYLSPRRFMDFFRYVDAGSAPSIHAARSMNQAALFAAFFDKTEISVALFVFALLICWSRVELRRHFKTDITTGSILGLLVAGLTVWLWN